MIAGTTIDSCRLIGQRDVAECNITGLDPALGTRCCFELFLLQSINQSISIHKSITAEISNALYDVRIAERCVDPRADSHWLVVFSE